MGYTSDADELFHDKLEGIQQDLRELIADAAARSDHKWGSDWVSDCSKNIATLADTLAVVYKSQHGGD